MRRITVPSFSQPTTAIKDYNNFRGLDLSTDASIIDDCRSPYMLNLISNLGGYPEKRLGWRTIHSFTGGGRVHSVFPFGNGEDLRFICHVGTDIIRLTPQEDGTFAQETLLSELSDTDSDAFYFGANLYFLTGAQFVRYDGTDADILTDDLCYTPTTTIQAKPDGTAGTSYERVNMINPRRKNTFIGDGSSKTFTFDVQDIDSVESVKVQVGNSETDYAVASVDTTAGKVTLVNAPPSPTVSGTANIVIVFKKANTDYDNAISKCRFHAIYGYNVGTRVFLSGNPDHPAREWYCGLNDPTYWPDLNYVNVGSDAFAIKGYLKFQTQLLILKEDNRHESCVYAHEASFDDSGAAIFPLKETAAHIGCAAAGSCRTLLDDPLFLSPDGVYAPILTYQAGMEVRNIRLRSERINPALRRIKNLDSAISTVWNGRYLLSFGDKCYVADGNQSMADGGYEWYYWENIPASCYCPHFRELFFGTADGRLCRFNDDMVTEDGKYLMSAYSDDGAEIPFEWRSKMDPLGYPSRYKTLDKRGNAVQLACMGRAHADIFVCTDKTFAQFVEKVETIYGDVLDFADIDFSRFTFNEFEALDLVFKIKAKNFQFIQVILKGGGVNEGFGLFGVSLHYILGDFAKRRRQRNA